MGRGPTSTLHEVRAGTFIRYNILGAPKYCRSGATSTYWGYPLSAPSFWLGCEAGSRSRFALVERRPPCRVARTLEHALSIPANFGTYVTSIPTPPAGVSGMIAGSVLPLRRAEELIATLPGVLSVRIVSNDSGAIDEVHVLTTDAVPPKATVRNIESALIAQLGLRVNHRKISIATTLDAPRAADVPRAAEVRAAEREVEVDRVSVRPPESALADAPTAPAASAAPGASMATGSSTVVSSGSEAAEGRRVLIFEDVEVRRSRAKGVLCRVTLQRAGSHFVGEAEGQETERSRMELAARATLQAIMQAVATTSGGERALALEGAKRIEAFDREFVLVSVTARLGRELVVLTGSCELRESAETSAVLAILDATNRWVHLER